VPEVLDGMNLTENAAKLVRIGSLIDKRFLLLSLSSGYAQEQLFEKVNQMAQPKLALHRIKSTALAIPPMNEQQRIVKKVDELMALCDQLKERLNQAGETRCQLAETIVESALQ
jgi:type I restriction enzyme S subunit